MKYPYFNHKSIKAVQKVLLSGNVNYWTGNENKSFEKEFSDYIGNKYSITLSNGSIALEIALKSLNLKPKDQVLVSPRSFIISASCAINVGLKPVFADVDSNGNLSIEGILKAFNKNIKVIILVHLNGLPCDLDPIIDFAKENNIYLIEDCSQAHGAIYKGKKVGSFGDISTWSFCQDKIITTGGEGGMVSTNNKKIWKNLWQLKDHGKNYDSVFKKSHKIGYKWLHDYLGSNYRMTEMQAAIGRNQLRTLDEQIEKRNLIANLYINGLKDYYQKYYLLKEPEFDFKKYNFKFNKKQDRYYRHAFYRLNLYINNYKLGLTEILEKLNSKNIECGVGPCPEIYREKIFKKLKLYPKKRLSNARLLGKTSLMFPLNPYRNLKEIKYEIKKIKEIFNDYI